MIKKIIFITLFLLIAFSVAFSVATSQYPKKSKKSAQTSVGLEVSQNDNNRGSSVTTDAQGVKKGCCPVEKVLACCAK